MSLNEIKVNNPIPYKKAYGESHSYNEYIKNKDQTDYFLIDTIDNKIIASFATYNIPKWLKLLDWNDRVLNLVTFFKLRELGIDINNKDSWKGMSSFKKYVKNIDEVKIQNPNKLTPGKKYWVYNTHKWEQMELEKEYGDVNHNRLLFKNPDGNGTLSVGKENYIKNKRISFSKEKPNYKPENIKEIKINQPGFNFTNFKPVVGLSKVKTDYFSEDYYIELVDIGNYYTFIPYGDQPHVLLIPKKYIEITDETGNADEEYVKAGIDNIKNLINQGKTILIEPINENLFSKEWWKNMLQLNESGFDPNINPKTEDDYIQDNLSAINKAALVFNFPVTDLQLAFKGASDLVLTDDIWAKLENSNSYNIQTLGQALLYSKESKIDSVPYLKAIKNMEPLPKPLILNYDNDKYYLVNGEFVLSLQKSLNLTPEVLVAIINPKIHEDGESEKEINLINEFINYVKNELNLIQIPKIDFSNDDNYVKENCSYGYFSPDSNIIWIYAGERNLADICRTLAHELVHRKQEEDGKIDNDSGETGSEIENEANAKAGVLLRNFGKKYPDVFTSKYVNKQINEIKVQRPISPAIRKLEQIKAEIEQTENKTTKANLAIKAVEFLLPIWNHLYPEDNRVKQVISSAKQGIYDYNIEDVDEETSGVANTIAMAVEYAAKAITDDSNSISYDSAGIRTDSAALALKYAIKATKEHFKINEVKIRPADINFTFPFWITKQNKLQASFIADQLNKQGYTLKGNKFTKEDITFNIPTILDYDSNYRDQPERKILNTYSPSNEIKIKKPIIQKMPRKIIINNKEVDEGTIEIEYDSSDYPDFSDSYAYNAQFVDGTHLDQDEIDELNDKYQDEIYEMILNILFEVKIQKPTQKIIKYPWEVVKAALVEEMRRTAVDLEFDDIDEYISNFKNELDKYDNLKNRFELLHKVYDELGWGDDEFLNDLEEIFVQK
jgi:hypothetical protein